MADAPVDITEELMYSSGSVIDKEVCNVACKLSEMVNDTELPVGSTSLVEGKTLKDDPLPPGKLLET